MFACPQANADASIRTFRCGGNEIKIGIRVLNNGKEIFRTCQDGFRVEKQTGFVLVTNNAPPDLLIVTQGGVKPSEATLYRKPKTPFVLVCATPPSMLSSGSFLTHEKPITSVFSIPQRHSCYTHVFT